MNLATCLGLSLYRFCQRAFYGPATLKALVKRLYRHTSFLCPRSHALSATIVFDKSICSPVSSLLLRGSPAAIDRPVTLRSIFSVNTVRCGRPRSHIGVEVLKGFHPASAYYDSVLSIARKVFRFRVIAALLHSIPGKVFRRAQHAVLSFTARTAAMAKVPSERETLERFFCSTFAATVPVDMLPRRMVCYLTKNCPFTKRLPGQVFEAGVSTSRIRLRHAKSPIQVSLVKVQRELQLLSVPFHFSSLMLRGQR